MENTNSQNTAASRSPAATRTISELLQYPGLLVDELKHELCSNCRPADFSVATKPPAKLGLTLPSGIGHLEIVSVAGRTFLRKPYAAEEAWKCEAFCRLQAAAAAEGGAALGVTPVAFALSAAALPPELAGQSLSLLRAHPCIFAVNCPAKPSS